MILFRVRRPNFNLFDSRRNLVLLVLFLLIFPKGGFKIHGIPITWGYLLLGLFSIGALLRKPIFVHCQRMSALIALLPFLAISACTMAINGISSFAMFFSFWINFLVLPISFFLLFSKDIETFNEPLFFRCLTKGIFFIAIYGIFLFILKQTTGSFLEIPLLTVNIGDLGQLEDKYIDRGNVFKLISTYNNGNIYGVCLLMLLPLYSFVETSRWKPWVVKLSLILTLSRTVWLGLFFYEIFFRMFISRKTKFPLIDAIEALIFLSSLLALLSSYYSFHWSFFIDPSLGGRKPQIEEMLNSGIFSTQPFENISEIVYAGIAGSFGWAGLGAYLFGMCGSVFYQSLSRPLGPSQRCIVLGLITYLFTSASDGAILYLPTMTFYWFLLSLLFRKNLAMREPIEKSRDALLPLHR